MSHCSPPTREDALRLLLCLEFVLLHVQKSVVGGVPRLLAILVRANAGTGVPGALVGMQHLAATREQAARTPRNEMLQAHQS